MDAPAPYRDLTDAKLLEFLATEGDRLTRAAVDEIVARGPRMVEPLTRILLTKDAWDEEEGTEFWRPVHAAYILAAIGGEKALPGLLAAITESLDTGCDWVTDELPSMFAAIGPVAIGPLLERVRAAEDDDLMELECLYSALGAIAVRHPDRRDELLNLLGDTVRDSNQSWARRFAAGATLMSFTRPDDRKPLLVVAREAEKMELPVFTTDDVEAMYSGKFKLTPAPPLDWLQFYSPEQIEKRQEVFSDELPDAEDEVDDDDLIREMDETPPVQEEGMPVINPAAPGRNDPCPCGSGKKYKKCCEP